MGIWDGWAHDESSYSSLDLHLPTREQSVPDLTRLAGVHAPITMGPIDSCSC